MCSSLIVRSCAFILLCGLVECASVNLFGAGASFPSVVYKRWINLYRKHRIRHVDLNMEYDSIGSGEGKARVKGERLPQVLYAGSDISLRDDEQSAHPDLTSFPTLAGAVVLAYNIPKLENLNLNLEAIVGIYNGTIRRWDYPLIATLNPGASLPSQEIVVVVRADKSGTTNVFTSGLSSASAEWKTKYGTFSEGLDIDTRQPAKWNNETVHFHGNTNRGMSGLVLSIDYSIGYVDVATAETSNLHYATLVNSAGSLVNATVETVQNAIASANGSFDIMNKPGPFAYPIASFTHFIVPLSTLEDCGAAVEFVRYVNWIYFNELAQEEASNNYMVPLDEATASYIVDKVLKVMTCGGKNIWAMMLEQIKAENENKKDYWQIPMLASSCIVAAVAAGIFVHFGRQKILLHKELLKETWRIDSTKISVDEATFLEKMIYGNWPTDINVDDKLMKSSAVDNRGVIGSFDGQPITMIKMVRLRTDFTLAEKKHMLWMRDYVKHENIMQFIGVTKRDRAWSMVHSGIFLGSLSEILRIHKLEIHTESLVALSKSLVKGLAYLHRRGIVHGHLNGMNCLLDMNWNLRISAWMETKIESHTQVITNTVCADEAGEANNRTLLLWVAPETIKFKRKPNQASDIYSLGMVFQEIFTRKEPYSELKMTSIEVLNAVLTCGIRPQIDAKTPAAFKFVIESSLDIDPAVRPRADTIHSAIKAAFPSEISCLDCVTRFSEQYAKQLEKTIKDQEAELKYLNEKMTTCLYQSVPSWVAGELKTKSRVEAETKENVCILVCKVVDITCLVKHITTKGIVNLLNNFYTGMDQILVQNDVYKLNRCGTETVLIIGLQRKNGKGFETKVAVEAASVSMNLNTFAKRFSRENLNGINTSLMVQTGLASGAIVAGVMGNLVPYYTALGKVVEEASELARDAEPSEIRMSEEVYLCLKEQDQLTGAQKVIKNEITCYSLNSHAAAKLSEARSLAGH